MLSTILILYMEVNAVSGPPDFLQVARQLQRKVMDAEFVYETDAIHPDNSKSWGDTNGKVIFLSAKGRFHTGGVAYFEYERDTGSGIMSFQRSIRREGETRQLTISKKPRSIPVQVTRRTDYGTIGFPMSFYHIWPAAMLVALPDSIWDEATHIGEKVIDGRACQVVKFSPFSGYDYHYAFDLARDGQIAEIEDYQDNKLRMRVHSYEFAEIADTKRNRYWIPVACKSDRYVTLEGKPEKFVYHSKPTTKPTAYRILPATVKLNTGLSPDKLEVRFDARSRVVTQQEIDAMPKLSKELAEAKKPIAVTDVREAIKAAEQQEALLKAQRLPSPSDWLSWLPFILGTLAIVGFMSAIFVWRRSS